MSPTEALSVWLYESRVADIERGRNGRLSLRFSEEATALLTGMDVSTIVGSAIGKAGRSPTFFGAMEESVET